DGLRVALVVTSDKVYENPQRGVPFRESDALGGHDPYAASKAAAEIVTASFARTYFDARGVAVATARGGNVIGGWGFAVDRIVPDIFRAMVDGRELVLRHPDATRPWQHVLDCVAGYIVYAQALAQGHDVPRALNFGPSGDAQITVAALAAGMQKALGIECGWRVIASNEAPEMVTLALDSRAERAVGAIGSSVVPRFGRPPTGTLRSRAVMTWPPSRDDRSRTIWADAARAGPYAFMPVLRRAARPRFCRSRRHPARQSQPA